MSTPDPTSPAPDDPRVKRVALSGEYDIARAADLRHAALDDDGDRPVVVLDFSEVTFVDSSGLRALLDVSAQLGSAGRTLHLVHLPPQVATLLEVTGTSGQFSIDGHSEG